MDKSQSPELPTDERDRLQALADLAILDSEAEREFDAVTRVAASLLGTESAAVSLIDHDRQWFKSRHNVDLEETSRSIAFCDQVVARRDALIVLNAAEDAAFRDNPLVRGEPHIRFYAGVPIHLKSGQCIGSLCLLDSRSRDSFGRDQLRLLEALASIVEELIEARKARSESSIAAEVVASTPDAVLATNREGDIVFWNDSAERIFGYSAIEALGGNVKQLIPDWLFERDRELFAATASGRNSELIGKVFEFEARRRDDTIIPVEISVAIWGDALQGGIAIVVRDITDRKAIEEERDRSRTFLDAVVSNLPSMLFVKDAETRQYLMVNRKVEDMVGLLPASVIGKTDRDLFPEGAAVLQQRDVDAITSGRPELTEDKFRRPNGKLIDIRTTRVIFDGPDRQRRYILGLSEDVTEIRKSEAERWKLARYDRLTDLLNRASMLEKVDELIRAGQRFAHIAVDLNRFKTVNDQFGQVVGDGILKEIGRRITDLADEQTLVARVDGDEFVCLVTGENLRHRAEHFAEELIAELSQPIAFGDIVAQVGVSIGGVVYPDDGTCIETLRQHTDLAVQRSKLEAKGKPCFFDDRMDAAERDRRRLELKLRAAVANAEIDVAYQPIIDARTCQISGFEALARWTDVQDGPISPDVFITLAEKIGLIDVLGEQVLRRACGEALNWPDHMHVAVNLSPRQFASGKLVETISAVLAETGLAAERLQLEVTESLVIANAEDAFGQLGRLKGKGIRIAVDDFGIGYSSLSYFQSFRFDKIKIDKSFVAEVENTLAAKAIVTAVVGLAQQLSMEVVAEGVETLAQQELLRELGATHLQGYLYSMPRPSDELGQFFLPNPANSANG